MSGYLHLLWSIEQAAVFEECNHPGERRSLPGRMIAKKLRPTVSISPSAGSRFQRISCSLPSARSGYVGSVFAFAIIGSVTCGFPDACSERVLESALCPCEFIYFVVW